MWARYYVKTKEKWKQTRALAEVIYACRPRFGKDKSPKVLPSGFCNPFHVDNSAAILERQRKFEAAGVERGQIEAEKDRQEILRLKKLGLL